MNDREYREQPYIRKIKDARAAGLIPSRSGVVMLEVLHEADCPLLSGQGPCRCDPDVGLLNRRERRAQRRRESQR